MACGKGLFASMLVRSLRRLSMQRRAAESSMLLFWLDLEPCNLKDEACCSACLGDAATQHTQHVALAMDIQWLPCHGVCSSSYTHWRCALQRAAEASCMIRTCSAMHDHTSRPCVATSVCTIVHLMLFCTTLSPCPCARSCTVITGDVVKEDDIIAQIETDKVTIDIKYTGKQPGKITQLMIKEQDVVQVRPGALLWGILMVCM